MKKLFSKTAPDSDTREKGGAEGRKYRRSPASNRGGKNHRKISETVENRALLPVYYVQEEKRKEVPP